MAHFSHFSCQLSLTNYKLDMKGTLNGSNILNTNCCLKNEGKIYFHLEWCIFKSVQVKITNLEPKIKGFSSREFG